MIPERSSLKVSLREERCAHLQPSGQVSIETKVELPAVLHRPGGFEQFVGVIAHQPVMTVSGDVRVHIEIVAEGKAPCQRMMVRRYPHVLEGFGGRALFRLKGYVLTVFRQGAFSFDS